MQGQHRFENDRHHTIKISAAIRWLRPRTQEMEVESSNLILQRRMYMSASYEMLYSTYTPKPVPQRLWWGEAIVMPQIMKIFMDASQSEICMNFYGMVPEKTLCQTNQTSIPYKVIQTGIPYQVMGSLISLRRVSTAI